MNKTKILILLVASFFLGSFFLQRCEAQRRVRTPGARTLAFYSGYNWHPPGTLYASGVGYFRPFVPRYSAWRYNPYVGGWPYYGVPNVRAQWQNALQNEVARRHRARDYRKYRSQLRTQEYFRKRRLKMLRKQFDLLEKQLDEEFNR